MKFFDKKLLISIFVCLLIAFYATCVTADVFVITSNAIWKVNDAGSVKIADKGPDDQIVVDGLSIPTPPIDPTDPPVDPSDPSSALEKMVLDAASLINEPQVSAVVGAGYQTAADGMKDGKAWDTMVSFTSSFRGIAVSRSEKKAQWLAMFASMDAEIAKNPQIAKTFQSVADGFKGAVQADGAPIEWFKLLECLPCIFDAFTSEEEVTIDKPISVLIKPDLFTPMYAKSVSDRAIINARYK